MGNALGGWSLISKRDGGVNASDAQCDQGGSRSVSPASSLTGTAEGTQVVVGETLQEKLSKKCKKLVLIIPTAAVIADGE